MAKDDYHVIVYQILSYLYGCLKNDEQVQPELIRYDSRYLEINKNYWLYIIENMVRAGLIEHVVLKENGNRVTGVSHLDRCRITPEGISYLCDNSFMAKEMLKDIKAIVPFV